MAVTDMAASRGTAGPMWSRWTYFLGVGQGGSTNLDAGGLLASLAVQAYGFKSLKFGQDQDWCMTGA